LASAGVRWLQPGIESMHDSLLRLMKKGNTALINVQLLKWAREFGIQVFWNFLVGLPGECGEWYAEMVAWLPLIAHLQPPTEETRQVRFDRFSPYYERLQEYGLTLVPQRTYSYIYPLDAQRLKDLAYSFEEVGEERKIPEHQRLREWVSEWQRLFKSESPPMLSVMEDNGDHMKLVDTRPCAIEQEISLDGVSLSSVCGMRSDFDISRTDGCSK
jgi:magnesium-protoporphyrin IX monomethyl ester (oxidative) cyclase